MRKIKIFNLGIQFLKPLLPKCCDKYLKNTNEILKSIKKIFNTRKKEYYTEKIYEKNSFKKPVLYFIISLEGKKF